MFYLLALIIKSENSLTWKANIFACDRFHMHCGIDKFYITCRKLITTIELQYYGNLRGNFNFNEFENISVWFDRQSIISIQSFFNVMEWKRPSNHFESPEFFYICQNLIWFCLIHKVDFYLVVENLRLSKWFVMYPVNVIFRNNT